ncbi:MAG: DUF4230 domain-containing protein [Winogradskyella sp.]|uniref:DUF4230 domain-containing protein n=1 Tax=Winogradskyella sp. TaxID=1883156 RepID=UPI00178FB393|nr:DUF4230 domain-containing protein [Winogradskyella sp.]MBT8244252.1 DUF4230 domain-containing protein [Winogradskyella sp.]NNK23473.1 DUF4230 domain-containing protein [Winogradskyella sp.]
MKKFLFGILLAVTIMLVYKQCTYQPTVVIKESSALIKEQLKNVSKLVVTEGHFSEVFNYEHSKGIFGDYLTAEKKALVVVNAKVSIAYDLEKLTYKLDEATKTLQILSIPEHEISINPDLEYYDIQDDFLNAFEAEDYNNIKKSVNASLLENIEKSNLVSNAQNRLISELSKFFILTNSLGWTLKYKENLIEDINQLESFKY